MNDVNEAIEKARLLFQKSRLSSETHFNNILAVIDETEDRENFIFQIISLIQNRTRSQITFLLAARGYHSQAKMKGVKVETLPQLVLKVKEKFIEDDEVYNVVFIPEEEIEPFERINEIINRIPIDLIIIPAPFTKFADGEEESKDSLGKTIDKIIFELLLKKNIPLFMIKKVVNTPLPFENVSILIRRSEIRKDLLGWILPLINEDATINIHHSENLSKKEENKIGLFFNAMKEHVEKENWRLKINYIPYSTLLHDFCDHISNLRENFVIIQALDTPEDPKALIRSLCLKNVNVLLFP